MPVGRALDACALAAGVALAGCGGSSGSSLTPIVADSGPSGGASEASTAVEWAGDAGSGDGAGFVPPPQTLGTVDASPPAAGCSDAARAFVYVLSITNDLYRFAPDKKTFAKIGAVACAPGQLPNSMAIDRNATAWIDYEDGTLYPVSTADASCQGKPVTLPAAWAVDGMAYSALTAGSARDVLYLSALGAAGLGWIDPSTGNVTPIGQYTGRLRGERAELTGTGDGRLFGFFQNSPVELAQVDPMTGAVLSRTPLAALQLTSASDFAFSFWGGRFYFYTYPNPGSTTTDVAEYDPATGTLDTAFMTDIGFLIVGAGVSSCAPLVPPIPR